MPKLAREPASLTLGRSLTINVQLEGPEAMAAKWRSQNYIYGSHTRSGIMQITTERPSTHALESGIMQELPENVRAAHYCQRQKDGHRALGLLSRGRYALKRQNSYQRGDQPRQVEFN